jgi:hypothetical protein
MLSLSFLIQKRMELVGDVWEYRIYPYLDYESRIHLNKVLKPHLRGKKKFTKLQIKQHAIQSVARSLTTRITIINNIISTEEKIREIKKLFTLLCRPRFQEVFYMENIRNVTLSKCSDFYNYSSELDEIIDELALIIGSYSGNTHSCPISV